MIVKQFTFDAQQGHEYELDDGWIPFALMTDWPTSTLSVWAYRQTFDFVEVPDTIPAEVEEGEV